MQQNYDANKAVDMRGYGEVELSVLADAPKAEPKSRLI
jgi:hypothetical protein